MNPEEIKDALSQFCGTENYHRVSIRGSLIYTDGVKAMAEMCKAYWLIDAIASWQSKCLKDEMLRDFQLWTLRHLPNGKWELVVERDTNDRAFVQVIEYSDFPLNEIKFYVEFGGDNLWVLMLPSER